ncbi:helix-turn-helix transcriptional regulator [Pseudoxanthomonas suwonensis]
METPCHAYREGCPLLPPPHPRLLRLPQVMDITGLSKPTIYRMVETGAFPKQRKLSPRAVGWLEHEVQEWALGCPVAQIGSTAVQIQDHRSSSARTATERPRETPNNNEGHPKAA